MIPLREQEYIRQRFASELKGRVKIDYFTQRPSPLIVPGREECTYCEDVRKMLEDLARLSEQITLTVREFAEEREAARKQGVDKVPGIVLRGPANRPVRFFGIPGGNEFPNFIETIIELSQPKIDLAPEAARQLKKLRDKASIAVYVTPTCPHCPGVVRAAYRLAAASAHVDAAAVEIGEFPRLAQQLGVRAVPLTVINDRVAIPGAMNEQTLTEQVLKAARGVDGEQREPAGATSEAAPAPQQEPGPSRGSGLILPR